MKAIAYLLLLALIITVGWMCKDILFGIGYH